MKNHVRKVCLQKKFLTFWDGDKCYFFWDFLIYTWLIYRALKCTSDNDRKTFLPDNPSIVFPLSSRWPNAILVCQIYIFPWFRMTNEKAQAEIFRGASAYKSYALSQTGHQFDSSDRMARIGPILSIVHASLEKIQHHPRWSNNTSSRLCALSSSAVGDVCDIHFGTATSHAGRDVVSVKRRIKKSKEDWFEWP